MSNFSTYNNVIDVLKDIANRSQILKGSFFLGKDFELENSEEINYPVLQVYPTVARMPRNQQGEYKTININLNMKVVDLVQKSKENQRDVHSDMLQLAQDIANEINQNPFYQESSISIQNDIDFNNLEEFEDSFTAGWSWDLSLQLINNNNFCGLPFDAINGIQYNGPIATGYSYSATLSCADLPNCPIIIEFDSRITALEALTGGTGNQVFINGSTGTFSIKANNDTSVDATGNYAFAEGDSNLASGQSAHAEGMNTVASGNRSHAEGNSSIANSESSHAEGFQTTAGAIGAHSEGIFTIASGSGSHSEGYLTTASGEKSHSEGELTIASGLTSHAEGISTIASGDYSHVEGYFSTVSGFASHAEGDHTNAQGGTSHAEGSNTSSSGTSSHAEGDSTTASGYASHAEGNGTLASGESSHSEGFGSQAIGYGSHVEGENSQAIGYASHAEGGSTKANKSYSHAEGVNTIASGDFSHAEGNETTASGESSHAEGVVAIASGYASHAEGNTTQAIGNFSHAEGSNTIANGDYSHAEGNSTQATGESAHAEGVATIASGFGSHAEGGGFSRFGFPSNTTIASGDGSHAEGVGNISSGFSSHVGGFRSMANGDYSFVHGSGSTAQGIGTIVLGNNLTGNSDNTVYANNLNLNGIKKTNASILFTDLDGNVTNNLYYYFEENAIYNRFWLQSPDGLQYLYNYVDNNGNSVIDGNSLSVDGFSTLFLRSDNGKIISYAKGAGANYGTRVDEFGLRIDVASNLFPIGNTEAFEVSQGNIKFANLATGSSKILGIDNVGIVKTISIPSLNQIAIGSGSGFTGSNALTYDGITLYANAKADFNYDAISYGGNYLLGPWTFGTNRPGYGVIGIQNKSNVGYSGVIFGQDDNTISLFVKGGTGVSGTFAGTSVPMTSTTIFQSGSGYDEPIHFAAGRITNQSGLATTNYGTRLDQNGFRIDTIDNIHTINTHPFAIGTGLTIATNSNLTIAKLASANTQMGIFTSTGILSATTLPVDTFVTGGTYSTGATLTLNQNQGQPPISVSGIGGTWTSYNASPVGLSAITVNNASYKIDNGTCKVALNIQGTSTATTFTILLPTTASTTFYPTTNDMSVLIPVTNAGAFNAGLCRVATVGNKTLTITSSPLAAAFTASGIKAVKGIFEFLI